MSEPSDPNPIPPVVATLLSRNLAPNLALTSGLVAAIANLAKPSPGAAAALEAFAGQTAKGIVARAVAPQANVLGVVPR